MLKTALSQRYLVLGGSSATRALNGHPWGLTAQRAMLLCLNPCCLSPAGHCPLGAWRPASLQ